MLNSLYDNYHFREQITDKGITFDYKIHDGQTTTRNAINLLDYLDFPEEVIDASKACAEGFDLTHQWKLF
jgi:DNA mismatch repair ATPase MutS